MLRKFYMLAFLLLAFLAMGTTHAKASDWPAYNSSVTNNNYISDPAALNSKAAEPQYIDALSTSGAQVIGGETFFYSDGQAQSTVFAYDVNSLTLKWSRSFSKQIARLAYSNGHLFFGSGAMYSLDAATGEIAWTLSLGTPYNAKVFHVDQGKIYGIRWYSNSSMLVVVDEVTGLLLSPTFSYLVDNVNDITLTENKILVTVSRYYGGGSSIVAYDRTSYQKLGGSLGGCRSSAASTVYDAAENIIYLSAGDAALCAYYGDTLAPVFGGRMINLSRLVKYGNVFYSAYGRTLQYFSALDRSAKVSNFGLSIDATSTFTGQPIVVNGTIYSVTNRGQLLARNLETGETKLFTIESPGNLDRIIYGAGKFVITSSYNNRKRFFFYNQANLGLIPKSANLVASSPYHTEGMNQYLGQTHAHVQPEREIDPAQVLKNSVTAADVITRYREAGYDFVALTEHNRIISDPFVQRVLHIQSEEDTRGAGGNHILALGIDTPIDESKSDQERIDAVVAQGGVPILAHPNSNQYGISVRELSNMRNYQTIEGYNNSVELWRMFAGSGLSLDKLDNILMTGKISYISAGDDYTPYDGGFDGAAISVFSPSVDRSDILNNIKNGNFYALEGSGAPRITSISSDNVSLSVSASEPSHITFIGKGGKELKGERDVTSAVYTYQGDEIYVRAEIKSATTAKRAWSQAVFISKPMQIDTVSAGSHDLYLDQATLSANTSATVSASTPSREEYPGINPPSGYISPVYKFETAGQVSDGTRLAISYAGRKLTGAAGNLSIYYYNTVDRIWETVPSQVDQASQVVSADLSHFSLYVLSAEIKDDTENPVVSLISPQVLEGLSSRVIIQAEAADNEAVMSVNFFVDGRNIGSDTDGSDGWSALLDTADFTNGAKKLIVAAEDFAGNTAEREYDISIAGGAPVILIDIASPAIGQRLSGISDISGNYQSGLGIEAVAIYLDDVYIDSAEINGNTYTKAIDWDMVMEGAHELRVVLRDIKANQEVAERDIEAGKRIESVISSPQNIAYLRGGNLLVDVAFTPEGESADIFIDGQRVVNHSAVDLLNFSFGQHSLAVKYQGETIASTMFRVTTNYEDMRNIVWRMYREGHIKNRGIAEAIMARLSALERLNLLMPRTNSRSFEPFKTFIGGQSTGSSIKIDNVAFDLLSSFLSFLGEIV